MLRKAGLLENVGWGRYRLTAGGNQVLASHPPKVGMKMLDQFPEYREWRGGGPTTAPGTAPKLPDVDLTPEEMLEATHRQRQASLESDLLDRVRAVSPSFFKRRQVDRQDDHPDRRDDPCEADDRIRC